MVLDESEDEESLAPFCEGNASLLVTCGSVARGAAIRLGRRTPPAMETPAHSDDVRLWRALSVCSPREVPLQFAAEVAGITSLSAETIPQVAPALGWALRAEWELGVRLAKHAFAFLQRERRVLEALSVMDQLLKAADRRGDEALAAECRWELSWFRDGSGALRAAPDVGEQLSLS
jgi:hypothetical protein